MTRAEAVEVINEYGVLFPSDKQEALDMAIEALEQEPKCGKWVDDNNSFNLFYANCSECGYQMNTHEERGYHNFCPNCGARMESDGK